MEDISLSDSSEIPLPPDQVEIRDLKAEPYEDGKRVHVYLTFTPFQEDPSAEVLVYDPKGKEIASVDIIETFDPNTEITLHLPDEGLAGEYRIRVNAFYLQRDLPEDESAEVGPPEKEMIGTKETTFVIPS